MFNCEICFRYWSGKVKKLKIGVICPSEIAFRRFMPAIMKCGCAKYAGVAYAGGEEWFGIETPDTALLEGERKKAENFKKNYGGPIFDGYGKLLASPEIDAVYIPLPPALHYKWAKAALEHGKHIFLEKPATTSPNDTAELINLAGAKRLAVHENYMFVFHRQISEIAEIIRSDKIGDVRLYRIAFGFPRRDRNDFRYCKALGGGALLDCGGYTVKLASLLLGGTAKVVYSRLNKTEEFDTDIYGSAALVNGDGVTAQISFGMDNAYKCELEVWGSKGVIRADRIFTAPEGFAPTAGITINGNTETVKLSPDDTFKKSIEYFCECVTHENTRAENYRAIAKQAELTETVKNNNFR